MKNEKRKMKNGGRVFLTLLIATCSLFICLSCENIAGPPKTVKPKAEAGAAATGQGYFALAPEKKGRTIMPEAVQDEFAAYTLKFVDSRVRGDGLSADTAFTLSNGRWLNGTVAAASSVVWYKFDVTSGVTYHVWWNDRYQGDSTKGGFVVVRAKYGNGTYIFGNATSDTTVYYGWTTAQSFTANQTGTVYLEVRPYSLTSSYTGTYGIVFSTGSTRPDTSNSITPPPTPITPNPDVTVDRTNDDLFLPVPLDPGTWNLYITAYMDAEKTKPLAWGESEFIVIDPEEITLRSVPLKPFADGAGEGTFSWNIEYPDNVTDAVMVITRLTPTTEAAAQTVPFFGVKTGSVSLQTGYYRVLFKLKTDDGLETERGETLHIYQNMNSNFAFEFEGSHFNSALTENIEDFGQGASISWVFHVSDTDEWNAAVSAVTSGGNNKNYIIYVTGDFDVANSTNATFGSASGITVSLRGDDCTLSLSQSSIGYMIRISNNQAVILRNLTLRGRSGNNNAVVSVYGGTFTINGGKISGNASTSSSFGGGVYVSGGTVRIANGTIYGSDEADTGLRNTTNGSGAALNRDSGTVQYGTLGDDGTWIRNGDINTNNDSIRIVNGKPVDGDGEDLPIQDDHIYNVANTAQWDRALNLIAVYGNSKNYTINATDNFEVTGRTTGSFGTASGVTVTLQGEGRTLTLGGDSGSLLYVSGSTQTVILKDLTLKGRSGTGSGSLVMVAGGTFIMQGGSISGNSSTATTTAFSHLAGGVYVHSGTFAMYGGEISDNTNSTNANAAGGVYVNGSNTASGTFIMYGGRISGNKNTMNSSTAYNVAGGVLVFGNNATFTMYGGEISGNSTATSSSGYGGGGVHVSENGTFTMNGGEISGNSVNRGAGGVYVRGSTATSYGTFRIVTGTIYGLDEAEESLRNYSTMTAITIQYYYSRAVLSRGDANNYGRAEYGTFSDNTWKSNGSPNTTAYTIRIKDGVPVYPDGSPLPIDDGTEFNVDGDWNGAVSVIATYANNSIATYGSISPGTINYTINVTGDTTVQARAVYSFEDARNITVTLQGEKTLTLVGQGNMLFLNGNQNVILRDLTLRGNTTIGDGLTNVSLVRIDGGTFTMYSGKISDNTGGYSGYGGGGVLLRSGTFTMHNGEISGNGSGNSEGGGVCVNGGTFTMYNGKIFGNTTPSGSTAGRGGGGVYVNGTFIMHDGEIFGNSGNGVWSGGANDRGGGGGVCVGSSGTFTMHNGKIYGNKSTNNTTDHGGGGVYVHGGTFRIANGTIYGSNETDPSLRNSSSYGTALFRYSGTVQYGTFSDDDTWSGTGMYTAMYTVRIVNGVPVDDDDLPLQIATDTEFTVAGTDDWNRATELIAAYGGNRNYTINVTDDFSVPGRNSMIASFRNTTGINVTIQGEKTLTLSDSGNILRIENNQTVTLRGLTLRGRSNNYDSLVYMIGANASLTIDGVEISGNAGGGVYMNGGSFTMNDGKISGNTISAADAYGGGVYVYNGTFTMNGGEISGNLAYASANAFGGGVFVYNGVNGTFTMNDGKISGNTASAISSGNAFGGGVYVGSGRTFTMNGGRITGNKAVNNTTPANSRGGGVFVYDSASTIFRIVTGIIYGSEEGVGNTAANGAALNRGTNGRAQYGTGASWPTTSNLTTTDETIRVEKGVLGVWHGLGSIASPVWHEGNDISLTAPYVGIESVTAEGWQISDTGTGGWEDFTPPSTADMSYNGKYLRYYVTSGGETYYSNTASIRVRSATEREVTIEMRNLTNNGWAGGAALRINVNGTDLATNARLAAIDRGGPLYYTFGVDTGYVVQFYWVNGGSLDRECAFAVYYSDNPPTTTFNPATGAAVSDAVLVYQLYRPTGSEAFGDGTLMGTFTAVAKEE